jgi:hypothetical protein
MDCAVLELPNAEESRLAGITVAVLEERVKNHVQFFWTVVAFLVAWVGVATYFLVDMRGDVKVLLRPQNLAKAASNPNDPKSQANAQKIIAEATKDSILLPEPIVEQTGTRFVNASQSDPKAWFVALAFLQYRSILNKSLLSSFHWLAISRANLQNLGDEFRGNQIYVSDETMPCPPPDFAQAHMSSDPPDKCRYILFFGGQVPPLDGQHFRSVIFQNVHISYNGGPLILDNVTFVDCTFEWPKPNSQVLQLASAILASPDVSFKSPKT